MTPDTLLVATSHGTRSVAGRAAVRGLVDALAARLPALDVVEAFVDVQQPRVAEVVAATGRPCVVVPLLLAPGFHVHVDVARAVRSHHATSARTLGPDLRIAELMAERLAQAGADRDDAVVLAASGSSDPRARHAVERSARLLSLVWGDEVTVGHLGGAGTPLEVALGHAARSGRRVAAAPFLLAPGFFHDRVLASSAAIVASPLLDGSAPDVRLVDVALDRVAEATITWQPRRAMARSTQM